MQVFDGNDSTSPVSTALSAAGMGREIIAFTADSTADMPSEAATRATPPGIPGISEGGLGRTD